MVFFFHLKKGTVEVHCNAINSTKSSPKHKKPQLETTMGKANRVSSLLIHEYHFDLSQNKDSFHTMVLDYMT